MSYVNLMSETPGTSVNGPGNRYMIHFQGCNLGCKNCFNPESWSFKTKELIHVNELINRIKNSNCDALGISGGEPFLQSKALLALLKALHENNNIPFKNGILIYSGFYEEELSEIEEYSEILKLVDLIVSGRFDYTKRVYESLISSSNQKYIWNETNGRGKHLIKESDLNSQDYEVVIDNSSLKISGFLPNWGKEVISALKSDGIKFEK